MKTCQGCRVTFNKCKYNSHTIYCSDITVTPSQQETMMYLQARREKQVSCKYSNCDLIRFRFKHIQNILITNTIIPTSIIDVVIQYLVFNETFYDNKQVYRGALTPSLNVNHLYFRSYKLSKLLSSEILPNLKNKKFKRQKVLL
jgi:hypothetical protein